MPCPRGTEIQVIYRSRESHNNRNPNKQKGMELMKKRIVALATVLALAFTLAACGESSVPTGSSNPSASTPPASQSANSENTSAVEPGLAGTVENPYVITFGNTANISNPDHPYMMAMNAMNDKLMELSGGTLGFDIVYGGVYGSTAQHLAQIKAGTLDGMVTGFDIATNLENSERFYAVCMPFVFDSDEHIDKFLDSDLWAEMVDDLAESSGVRIASLFFHQPPRSLNTTTPVAHPSEMAGVKLRVPESDVQVKVWTAAGASPVQIPGSEMYSAIDTGIADGQENDIPTAISLKFYEVAPYFTEIDYIRQAQFLYTSEITWQKMNDQEKGWFLEAAAAGQAAAAERYETMYDEAIAEIEENGGTIVEFDYDEWKTFFTDIVKNEFDGVLYPAGLYDQIQAMS